MYLSEFTKRVSKHVNLTATTNTLAVISTGTQKHVHCTASILILQISSIMISSP